MASGTFPRCVLVRKAEGHVGPWAPRWGCLPAPAGFRARHSTGHASPGNVTAAGRHCFSLQGALCPVSAVTLRRAGQVARGTLVESRRGVAACGCRAIAEGAAAGAARVSQGLGRFPTERWEVTVPSGEPPEGLEWPPRRGGDRTASAEQAAWAPGRVPVLLARGPEEPASKPGRRGCWGHGEGTWGILRRPVPGLPAACLSAFSPTSSPFF